MMFVFLLSLFGFAIAIRIIDRLITRSLFDRNEMTKIGTAYFSMVFIAMIALPHRRSSAWIAVFAPLAMTGVALLALVRRRSRDFRSRMREALAIIALKMKSGRSFRQSLAETVIELEPRMRAKLSEIANVVVFSQQRASMRAEDAFVDDIIDELTQIDRNPHAASRRLAILREKLRAEDDFRRRSGQVLARIHAQSLLMTGLYLALLVFMTWKFGVRDNLKSLSISLALFIAGGVWVHWGGKRLRWKV